MGLWKTDTLLICKRLQCGGRLAIIGRNKKWLDDTFCGFYKPSVNAIVSQGDEMFDDPDHLWLGDPANDWLRDYCCEPLFPMFEIAYDRGSVVELRTINDGVSWFDPQQSCQIPLVKRFVHLSSYGGDGMCLLVPECCVFP